MNEKNQRPEQDDIEQQLRIHSLKLQLSSYERDLSKYYLWREWLKAAATVIAFIGIASTLIWTLIQNSKAEKARIEEDRARRFESAINRLGSHDANSRLTGIAGLSTFVTAKDSQFQVSAWNSLVQATSVEDDVIVRASLLGSIHDLPSNQTMLDGGLKTIIALNNSLAQSLVNPAANEHHLPTEPLARAQRLVAMADVIDTFVRRGAKSTNFVGIYCVGCDFRNLSGMDHINFHTAIIDAANFSGVALSSADFSNTSLVSTDFNHAILHDANFKDANGKPFFWYLSFADDPADTGPSFRCADVSGSNFEGFLVEGYKITKGKNGWYPSTLGSAGNRWFGANLARTKFHSLEAYYVSTEGKITTPGIDDDLQVSFKDALGKERWMGIKAVYGRGHAHIHDDPVLDGWDDVTWRRFDMVLDATDAELPKKMRLNIDATHSDPRYKQQIQHECGNP